MKHLRLVSVVFFLAAFLFLPHIPGSVAGQRDTGVGSDWCSLAPLASAPWFSVFGPPVRLTDTPNIEENRPSLAKDRWGNMHLAYEGNGHIYYMSSVCGRFRPPVQVSASMTDAHRPSLAVDGNGRAHIAFFKEVEGMHYGVYYTSGPGGTFAPPVLN